MTSTLFATNLLAWSAQVAILVGVAALVSLALSAARARLMFWQGILAMILLLPVAVPWTQPPPEAIPNDSGVSITMTSAVVDPSAASFDLWRMETLLWALTIGAGARLLWIGAGLLRLRRMRLTAAPLTDGPQFMFGARNVRWYVSDRVSGPVTFGFRTPSILLPARVTALPESARDAIVCHELLHIERRDWLFVLAEEIIRAALWFHPAVWFTLAKIQLAREECVDQEVVRRTQDREGYVDALLAVAGQQVHRGLEPDVAPAPLFLKKRHLAVRVAAVISQSVQEASMSTVRLASRFAIASTAALAGAAFAVWFFPLQSPAQSLPDDSGIIVDAGGKLMHRTPLRYPRGASAGGTVVIEATLNKDGEVTDARVLSGPDELRKSALTSVLDWHFEGNGAAPPSTRISIQYGARSASAEPIAAVGGRVVREALPGQRGKTAPVPVPDPVHGPVQAITFAAGVTPELRQKVEQRLPIRVGDVIDATRVAEATKALKEIDEHLVAGFRARKAQDGASVVDVSILLRGDVPFSVGGVIPPPPPPPPPPVAAGTDSTGATRLRVSGDVQAVNLITKVTPPYPALAKAVRIQGTVRLNATIGKDGTVQDLQLVSGHPMLVESATQAVRQWVYRPTLLNGQPTEVITQIDVNYTLAGEAPPAQQ